MNADTFEKWQKEYDVKTLATAHALLRDVRQALANGTKHYNKAGELLTTERQIIECLLAEGGVTFETPEGFRHEC